MKRIIHFNHNDKNNTNIGDQAHVYAIQQTLSELLDNDVQFVNRSIQLLSKQAVPSKPYYPKSKMYPAFVHNIYRALSGESAGKLIAECNNSDLVLIGGGGVYMGYLFPLYDELVQRISTPIVLFGVGYNHNIGTAEFNEQQARSAKILSSKAEILTVRDEATQTFLNQLGIDSDLMCDPAIFLSNDDSGTNIEKTGDIKIGVNMARHGWSKQKNLEKKIVTSYAEFIFAVKQEFSAQFYYFVHHPKELKYVEALKAKGVIFDGIIDTDARKTKRAYEQMDLSISMMLHSSILSFGSGIPTISVGYDKKNLAFMELTDQKDSYISVMELSSQRLLSAFKNIMKDRPERVEMLSKRKGELEKEYIGHANAVVSILR